MYQFRIEHTYMYMYNVRQQVLKTTKCWLCFRNLNYKVQIPKTEPTSCLSIIYDTHACTCIRCMVTCTCIRCIDTCTCIRCMVTCTCIRCIVTCTCIRCIVTISLLPDNYIQ